MNVQFGDDSVKVSGVDATEEVLGRAEARLVALHDLELDVLVWKSKTQLNTDLITVKMVVFLPLSFSWATMSLCEVARENCLSSEPLMLT